MGQDIITILGERLQEIDIGATGVAEIVQNVRTILATWRGTVFLDRTFGVDPDIIDLPIAEAQARCISDVIPEIHKQEDRVEVVSINFTQSVVKQGKLVPVARIRIKQGVLL